MIIIVFITAFLSALIYTYITNLKPNNFPPGPLSLPIIGGLYALGLEPHKNIMKLRKKYGKLVGIDLGSSRAVILTDLTSIKEALDSQIFNDRPDFEVSRVYRNRIHTGLIWARGKNYDEQRRHVMKSLRDFGMGRKFTEKTISTHLQNLFEFFETKVEEPIINSKLFNSITFQVLWTVVAGENLGSEDEDIINCIESSNRMISASSSASNIFYFPTISKLFPNWSGWNTYMEAGKMQMKFLEKSVQSRKEKMAKAEVREPQDFIEAYIQKIRNTENKESSFFGKLGDDNLVAVLGDLFITGTETVSTALTWSLLLLTLHPEVQHKMQNQIKTVLRDKSTLPTLDDRNKLPYVEAVIFEILRYSALVPLSFPHEACEDTYLQGYFLPKGTIVIPYHYGVLHDPELWYQPEDFNPDRFLSEDGSFVSPNKGFNISFGAGKRLCIGQAMGKDEMFLILTGLVQRFTFSVDPNSPKPKMEGKLGTTLTPYPHSMIIRKR